MPRIAAETGYRDTEEMLGEFHQKAGRGYPRLTFLLSARSFVTRSAWPTVVSKADAMSKGTLG
jgi:hypothetical protein